MINLSQRSLLALFSRIVLGVVLIYASIDKIIHPEAFAKLIGNYNVLPFGLENVVAIILPTLELIVGCCLILGIMLDGSAIITAGMMIVFIFALSQAMIRGIDVSCGCFNVSEAEEGSQIGFRRIIEDIIFLGLSIILLVKDKKVILLSSLRYLVLSLNTGPIIIFTPSSTSFLETLSASIGFDRRNDSVDTYIKNATSNSTLLC